MGLKTQSHEWTKDTRTGQLVITKENHYIRMSAKDQGAIYLQAGRAYYEDGEEVSDLPEWVTIQFKTLNPALLKRVGWEQGLSLPIPTLDSSAPNSPSATQVEQASDQTAVDRILDGGIVGAGDPLAMKYFALKAWAKRTHDVSGDSREAIIDQLIAKGVIKE